MSALVCIEVDDRHGLIARHGEEIYEELCDQLTRRLREWLRDKDRLRSEAKDSFVALLKGLTDPAEIRLAASKLQRLIQSPYNVVGEHILLPVTVGFAFVPQQFKGETAAMHQARAALVQARRERVPYALYDATKTAAPDRDAKVLARLHRALDVGDFMVLYQPKVSAAFRTTVGAEVLLRLMNRRKKTLISPAKFIDVAERNPIIKPITEWVAKSAIARCARWAGDVGVAINVAPPVLQDADLQHTIVDALALHDVAAQRVTVEVTESALAENQGLMFERLAQLREVGVKVSIDDFGTGYSSFAYFRDIPADEIKIDRTFVQALATSRVDRAIVKSIVELAKNFNLNVVAEGVEDEATAERLVELGCDTLQGFLIDKPLLAEDFERHNALCKRAV